MPHDFDLAERVRTHLARRAVREQATFNGQAFLVSGHIALVANRQDELLVRSTTEEAAVLVVETAAELALLRGRTRLDWLSVDTEHISDAELATWIDRGVANAEALPPKF